MTNKNIYLSQITQTLPRLLSLFDSDQTSDSYGMGDRYYWAWGLIDFSNGSYQGAANGLARLWKSGYWPYETGHRFFLQRLNAIFGAAKNLTRKDGSLEEAFPREGSYCVTALVAYDLLCAIELLENDIEPSTLSDWLGIIAPMINYLNQSDETHAIISNHLATAVAALVRWQLYFRNDESEKKVQLLIARILKHQSTEGWFKEYDGADPGYQTLCTYYLADIHQKRPDLNLLQPLRNSVVFLWHFAHPDGSFGGLYGSRCTRFYFPAGFEMLAAEIPEAAELAYFMGRSIENGKVVTLNTMDESNLIPMFNAYCRAASESEKSVQVLQDKRKKIPCITSRSRINFPLAGLIIDGGEKHYSIISTHKGGVVMHFKDKKLNICDGGVVVKNSSGKLGSSQSVSPENKIVINQDSVVIKSTIVPMPKQLSKPIDFMILRGLSLTFFRIPPFRERIKKILVYLLITRKKKWPSVNLRKITFGYDLTVEDTLKAPPTFTLIEDQKYFVSIHMASQGYWQIQDEIIL